MRFSTLAWQISRGEPGDGNADAGPHRRQFFEKRRMDNEKKVKVIDKLRKKNCHWYMPILVKEIQML